MLSALLTPAFQLAGAAIFVFVVILFLLNLKRSHNAREAIAAVQASAKDIAIAAKAELTEASGQSGDPEK